MLYTALCEDKSLTAKPENSPSKYKKKILKERKTDYAKLVKTKRFLSRSSLLIIIIVYMVTKLNLSYLKKNKLVYQVFIVCDLY